MTGASIETELELWAASLRDVKARMRGLFTLGRVVASAGERPVTIRGVTIEPRGSFGLAISPDHCDNSIDLQRFADLALYKSKSAALGEVIIFENMSIQAYEYLFAVGKVLRAAPSTPPPSFSTDQGGKRTLKRDEKMVTTELIAK